MKDFFLLVKAIRLSSIRITKKKNGKTWTPKTISISQILTSLLIALYFAISYLPTLYELYHNHASSETIFLFVKLSMTGYLLYAFFMSVLYVPHLFFSPSNDTFLSLPITGNRLFLARLFIAFYLNFLYGGLVILVVFMATCIILSLGFLSYLLALLSALLLLIMIPLLSFLFVNALQGMIDFRSKPNFLSVFLIVIGVLSGLSFVFNSAVNTRITSIQTAYEELASFDQYACVISWIGYLPTKSILLFNSGDWMYFIALLFLTAAAFVLTFFVSKKTYLAHLSLRKGRKKKKRKIDTKRLLEKHASSLKHPFLIQAKREFSNAFHGSLAFTNSLISMIAVSVSFLTTAIVLDRSGIFNKNNTQYLYFILLVLFGYSLYVGMLPFTAMSLEKDNMKMLLTFPLKNRHLVLSKILPSLVLSLPFYLVLLLAYTFLFRLTLDMFLSFVCFGFGYLLLTTILNFYLGLVFVNFSYDNISDLTRRGIGPILARLVPLLLLGANIGFDILGYEIFQSLSFGGIVSGGIYLIVSVVFYFLSTKRIKRIYQEEYAY